MLHPIDIIDKENHQLGIQSDPEKANNEGLWHRGVHVIVITPSGHLLVQKRSRRMQFHPQMLDIGVGGFVDSGETPEQAVIRELKEETGLHIKPDKLIFLGLSRYNHLWRFGDRTKTSRTIIYTYALSFQKDPHSLAPQKEEVEWIGFIPFKSALWLIRHGSIKRLGKLVKTYAYFQKFVRLARKSTAEER
jgi:8-oxo-dGTP pyrophosphatase MutT (NUDIX family)